MVYAALFIVQVLFATLAIAGKLALRELPPAGLVLLRVTGAAVAFAVLLRAFGVVETPERRDLPRLALYSLLGVVANQLLYVQGLAHTTAINANILITTVPVFTLGVALILRTERPSARRVAGLLLAMTGAVILLDPGRFDLAQGDTLGNAMILLNALSYAVYLVISKALLARYRPLTVVTWVFVFGALGVAPFGAAALAGTDLAAVPLGTWLTVLYIVLVPTVAVYWLNLWALERAESSLVAIYVYVQPVVTALMAPAVLGERLDLRAAVAGLVIFAAIGLATVPRRGRRVEEALEETPV